VNTCHLVLSVALLLFVSGGAAAQSEQAAQAEQTQEDAGKGAAEFAEAIVKAQAKAFQDLERDAMAAATPIEVEIVMSRYQGDKKVSSLPYLLTVNASDRTEETRLRMGASVPVPSMAPATGPDGKPITLGGFPSPVTYQDVSTEIDCRARPLGDGRFELFISVSDRALATSQEPNATIGNLPVIRTFQSSNSIILRDGQTRQFIAAADRITGEVVRVDVTLRVVK
jgi:hypothetical protein